MQNEIPMKLRALRPITINLSIDGRPRSVNFAEGAPPKRVMIFVHVRHGVQMRGGTRYIKGFRIEDRNMTISHINK